MLHERLENARDRVVKVIQAARSAYGLQIKLAIIDRLGQT